MALLEYLRIPIQDMFTVLRVIRIHYCLLRGFALLASYLYLYVFLCILINPLRWRHFSIRLPCLFLRLHIRLRMIVCIILGMPRVVALIMCTCAYVYVGVYAGVPMYDCT